MASETKVTLPKEQVPQEEDPASLSDRPLLDLSDAAIKKLIQTVKNRGYVTHDQINSVLPSEEVNSEQIEDVLAMFSEMGVNVVETEEASDDEEQREEPEEEAEAESSELVEVARAVPIKFEAKEPTERTDDPVRMYLREMGSLELLSRQGEIAIAKRIEAGREAMIAGLCESPLTFQAIIIWRDELHEGKVFLRPNSRPPFRHTATLAPPKGRLIRWTVPGSTPKRAAILRTPSVRPGLSNAALMAFSTSGDIGGRPSRPCGRLPVLTSALARGRPAFMTLPVRPEGPYGLHTGISRVSFQPAGDCHAGAVQSKQGEPHHVGGF
jgi:hypothetical protein